MKAAIINQFGSSNELTVVDNYDEPDIADNEVLIETFATSVNPIDYKARQGALRGMFNWTFPVVLGWDIAGVITKAGANVTEFSVSDRVFARPDMDVTGKFGSYATLMAVNVDKVALMPDKMTFAEAAALPLAGETALQMLRTLQVTAGSKVLIQAGAGGVGIVAIQLAKLMGATVATTAGHANTEFVRQLGADIVIDYHERSITDVISNYDAVLDSVGDIDAGLDVLAPGGQLVTISANPTEEQLATAEKMHKTLTAGWLHPSGQDLAELASYYQNDQLRVVIDSKFPFTTDGVRSAHERVESHHARGKVVIEMKPE
ncbi:NADP-dependent oxidoreductase [Weissella confusa]